jgi:uncharacterized repeat protein (TIGR02543 family)
MKKKIIAGLAVLLTVAALVPGMNVLARVDEPHITVSPSSIDFGTIRSGYEESQQVKITNDGTAYLDIGTIAITGADTGEFIKPAGADSCSGGHYAPTGWGTLTVVFHPTSPGTKSAYLSIPSNDPGGLVNIALTGVSDPDITVSPSSIDFGDVKVGNESPGQTVKITNDGGPPLIIGTIATTGTDAGEFRITIDTCSGVNYAPGGWGTFSVVFRPTSPGTKSAYLSIPSNDLDEPTVNVPLTGRGTGNNLTVTSTAGGSVTTPGEGTFAYNPGAVVNLVATPDAGYGFVNWTGDTAAIANVNAASTTITMNGNYTITATFTQNTVVISDTGLLGLCDITTDGTYLYTSGTGQNNNPVIARIPIAGGSATSLYQYGASPLELGVVGDYISWVDPNSGPYTDTNIFKAPKDGSGPITTILTSSQAGNNLEDGSGLTTDGVKLYAADEIRGRVYSLNLDGSGLTQLAGDRYSGWFDTEHYNSIDESEGVLYIADSGKAGVIQPQVVTIPTTGASSFAPLWVGEPFVRPMGVAVGLGKVFVTDPDAGNTIWVLPTTGGQPTALISGAPFLSLFGITFFNNALYVVDSGARVVYRVDLQYTTTLTMAVNGNGSTDPLVGTHTYPQGTVVNITATPASGWQFDGWTGDVADPTSATTTVTMNTDKTVTANFAAIAVVPGDANGDGVVDALDITVVERIIARLDPPTAGADANQDGKINALDITKVELIIAGLK